MEAAGQGHLRPGVPVRAARRRTGGPTAEYSISKWIYGELPFTRCPLQCGCVFGQHIYIYMNESIISPVHEVCGSLFDVRCFPPSAELFANSTRRGPLCCIACSSWWSRSSRPRRRRRTRAWVRTTPRRTVRGHHQPAPHGPWLPPDVHFALVADGECCAQGNYKKEGHGCAAALLPAYNPPRTNL